MSAAPKPRLLFVEDDAGLRRQLRWSFSDYEVFDAAERESALDIVRTKRPAVVVLDLGLPPDTQGASEGLATLEEIRIEEPGVKVIIMSGNEDRANALKAIGLGAYDFCQKPMDLDVLKLIIGRAHNLHQLESELRQANQAVDNTPLRGVVTCAPEMLQICRMVEKVAPTDVTVLLLGESGTGKEVLARALHEMSPRRERPFIAINCGAIPENLLESELFGHEKGSFTGAIKQSIGKVELANEGTLFLDEIGDVPFPLQVKLLRFLQERTIERIGGRQQIPVDVRIVCATNQNIPEMIKEGRYRGDLLYRLNEFVIEIPPLRARSGDALVLAHYFLNSFAAQYHGSVRGFTSEARAAIQQHAWPGNVREMQSRLKRAVLMAESDLVSAAELDLTPGEPELEETEGTATLREVRQNAERTAVEQALAQVEGNVLQAAKLLGVSRPTLYGLIRNYKIKV